MRYKLKRLTVVQLEQRFSSPVHDLTPDSFEIPAYVKAYLAKGGKFIPDTAQSTAMSLLWEVDSLERSLNLAVHFRDYNDSMPRLQNTRCRLRSSWQPPSNSSVSTYCRLLRAELSRHSPHARARNSDFIDKAARAWLSSHPAQVCVVDADKNLGDAILSRSWVQQESLRLLKEAAFVIPTTCPKQSS